jgi:hypothetical protein
MKQSLSWLALAGVLSVLSLWYYAAFIRPNHPPRPANVPPSATLILRGFDAFWQYCWVDQTINRDRCQIFNRGGTILRDDIFIPYDGSDLVLADKLKIGPSGNSAYVKLEDGTVLIPQKNYDAIKRSLTPSQPQ